MSSSAITRTTRRAAAWASPVSWMFILLSLGWLAIAFVQHAADPAGTTALFQAGGRGLDGAGLSYSGAWGLMHIMTQMAVVLIAAVVTVLPWSTPRRIGHVLLIAWAGLFVGHGAVATVNGGPFLALPTGVLAAMFLAIITRTVRGWSARKTHEPLLTIAAVAIGPRAEEAEVHKSADMSDTPDTPDTPEATRPTVRDRAGVVAHRAQQAATATWRGGRALSRRAAEQIRTVARDRVKPAAAAGARVAADKSRHGIGRVWTSLTDWLRAKAVLPTKTSRA